PGGQAGLSSRYRELSRFPIGAQRRRSCPAGGSAAKRFGAEILAPQEALRVRREGPYHVISLVDGGELSCHALVIASGVQWRKLDVPGMDRLQGAGVYYGAGPTEALSCCEEDVYIVGGANSAGQSAIHFARYARNVTMLVRGNSLAATMS